MMKACNAEPGGEIEQSYLWDRDQGESVGVAPSFEDPAAMLLAEAHADPQGENDSAALEANTSMNSGRSQTSHGASQYNSAQLASSGPQASSTKAAAALTQRPSSIYSSRMAPSHPPTGVSGAKNTSN